MTQRRSRIPSARQSRSYSPARDEAEKVPGALATFLALDYPRYEVIAVDDRSDDRTGAILETAARKDARLKAVHVSPARRLAGKAARLQQAYEHSSGEWLVFTDADVHFAPDLLRRAVALAERKRLGPYDAARRAKNVYAWRKNRNDVFRAGFLIGTRPWDASNRDSRWIQRVSAPFS